MKIAVVEIGGYVLVVFAAAVAAGFPARPSSSV